MIRRALVTFASLGLATGLAACQIGPTHMTEGQDGRGPEPMGNATAVASPPAQDPAGEILGIGEVTDLAVDGQHITARVADDVFVGTLDQLRDGTARRIDATGCTDLTGAPFVLACGETVRLIDAEGSQDESIDIGHPIHSAVQASSGEVIAASGEENLVWVHRAGEDATQIEVDKPTDELLLTQGDHVLRINRETTTIQDVQWRDARQGGTLRVGLGVGTLNAGPEGTAVVSDTRGYQLFLYTAGDVVRLHQTAPTETSPYATAWYNDRAWIASTANNVAQSFDVSGGVPVEDTRFNTIANVRVMASTSEGLILGGPAGLQIVKP